MSDANENVAALMEPGLGELLAKAEAAMADATGEIAAVTAEIRASEQCHIEAIAARTRFAERLRRLDTMTCAGKPSPLLMAHKISLAAAVQSAGVKLSQAKQRLHAAHKKLEDATLARIQLLRMGNGH